MERPILRHWWQTAERRDLARIAMLERRSYDCGREDGRRIALGLEPCHSELLTRPDHPAPELRGGRHASFYRRGVRDGYALGAAEAAQYPHAMPAVPAGAQRIVMGLISAEEAR